MTPQEKLDVLREEWDDYRKDCRHYFVYGRYKTADVCELVSHSDNVVICNLYACPRLNRDAEKTSANS